MLVSNTICISHVVCVIDSNTTDVTSGPGTAFPAGAPEFVLLSLQFSGKCFIDHCLSFCRFSFCHSIVCPAMIYGF